MKTALITGGSSGIGEALGRVLARRGYRVALAARRRDLLDGLVGRIRSEGGEAIAVLCDVTDAVSVAAAAAETEMQLGPIDLAIANAGIGYPTPALKFDLTKAEAIMKTNFFGTLYLFAAVIPGMIARGGGQFAGIASLAGLRGLPGASLYSASKAAMQAFLEASRVELAPANVSVTIVNPGFIETAMTEKNRFRMPMLMSVERAAVVIADGLEARKREIEFPLPMSLGVRLLRLIPNAIFDRVTAPYSKKKVETRG